MSDQEDIFASDKIVFDDNNQERKSWTFLGQSCSRSVIVFLPTSLLSCCLSLVTLREFIFQKLVTNQQFGWELCVEQLDTFYKQQEYEQVNFYKKLRL